MSKFLTLILIATLGIFSLTGCTKKEPTLPPFAMSATVGTSGFSTGSCTAIAAGGSLQILGKTGEAPVITIWLTNWSGGMGTSIISGVSANTYILYTDGRSVVSGAVTITSMSSTDITGIFYGTLTDGTVITDGKFCAERI